MGATADSGVAAWQHGQIMRTAGHLLCVVAADLLGGVHQVRLPRRRDEADADPFDAVRAGGSTRQHCGLRGLHRHHPSRCRGLAEPARRAMDRVGGAHGMHERVDPAAGLSPDLLAEGKVPAHPVVVAQLVGPPVPGTLADLRAEREHGLALLDAERVREHHM